MQGNQGAISYVIWLRWLLGHLGSVQQLIALASAVVSAADLPSKWQALKDLGDVLVPILDDFPTVEPAAMSITALADAQAELKAAGVDLEQLEKLFPVFEMLLPILLKLLQK